MTLNAALERLFEKELLAKHAANLTPEEMRLILHDNVAELYGLAEA